jgi:mono/diheme cytochrome c family protein
VTEIPEHLLKRSKERRGALEGEATGAPVEPQKPVLAVAKAGTVAAVPAAPPPPKPDPAYVAAAKSRKKIPFWAMATLSLLPLWAFVYLLALTPQEKTVEGPLAIGAEVYGSCAGCHGAAGQGGAGRAFANGEVLKTFPKIEDMLNFVYTGSQAYVAKELAVYGNADREGGAHKPLSYNGNPMPQQGQMLGGALTEAEILGVVCHERYALGGADSASEEWIEEYETWCSPESEIFLALETGAATFSTLDKDFTMLPKPPAFVGVEARASTK